ncbi:ArsA family ATPase [Microbacterium sp. NPDC077391]|uniref:ArsA family ATPase n=2 Tax=Microbacterium commune TaxID=2762219 RepID=A0ABR8W7L9_9MICO|nr:MULTISPECIES: ArsA family ATPase [unclassified Microbacterium]MBD8012991.1 ArsA family ATPase [Microbacterium commune]OIU87587.1 arsenic-transporting ATPase [Microbacterium sp. AR7-10]
MLLDALRRPMLFVGGKGGVGKTSLASALAVARARDGERVLVVSTDPAHNLGHLWRREVGDAPVRLADFARGSLDGVEVDPHATIDRHLDAVEKTMTRMLPERQHRAAREHLERARHAPGSHESAVLERIAELAEAGQRDYDAVIFDTAPSGHTLRLLALPGQLAGWTETLLRNRDRSERFSAAMRGLAGTADPQAEAQADLRRALQRRRDRFSGMQQAIADPARTGFVVVFTAEALPVAETLEVVQSLRSMGVTVAGLVANRRSPADGGEVLAARRTVEDAHLQHVRDAVPDAPVLEIPLVPGELTGPEALTTLAGLLECAAVG